MQGIYIKRQNIDFEISNNDTVLSLLAEHENVEIMIQTIKENSLVWISPGDELNLMEFFYILEGSLSLISDQEEAFLKKMIAFMYLI